MDNTKLRRRTGDWQRRRILRFVQEFGRRQGYSPSYRKIAEELGLAVSTVSYHVSVLEQEGSLRRGPGQPRTIVEPAHPATRAEDGEVEVPLIGRRLGRPRHHRGQHRRSLARRVRGSRPVRGQGRREGDMASLGQHPARRPPGPRQDHPPRRARVPRPAGHRHPAVRRSRPPGSPRPRPATSAACALNRRQPGSARPAPCSRDG